MRSLKYIICCATNPPEVQDKIPNYSQSMRKLGISPITEGVTLIVPTKSIEEYSRHDFWGKFEIEGFSNEPVD